MRVSAFVMVNGCRGVWETAVEASGGAGEGKLLGALLLRAVLAAGGSAADGQQCREGGQVRISAENIHGTVLPKIPAVFRRDAPFGAGVRISGKSMFD